MKAAFGIIGLCVVVLCGLRDVQAQRITTIQLEGTQYFISRMNPYSPELNYYLAYQYCRSIGLQLVSFESSEKSDAMTTFLSNSGYSKYEFWTSGNKLGTDMYLWMSTGLPFNTTFNYMSKAAKSGRAITRPQRIYRAMPGAQVSQECVSLSGPGLHWDIDDCLSVKDFICEQTRCYYYNYGAIPVTASQGFSMPLSPHRPHPMLMQTTSRPPIVFKKSRRTTTVQPDEDSTHFEDEEMDDSTVVYMADSEMEEVITEGPYRSDNEEDRRLYADQPEQEENDYSTVEPTIY